MIIVMKRAYKI